MSIDQNTPSSSSLSEAARMSMANQEFESQQKSFGAAFALWWFTGVFGGHRFYTGDTGIALGMLFTLGGCGFWALFDVFGLGQRIKLYNSSLRREIYAKHGFTV